MKILLAIDGSESADTAIEFLRKWPIAKNTELVLMTVINKEAFGDEKIHEFDDRQRQMLVQAEKMLHEDAEEVLTAAENQVGLAGLTAEKIIAVGHPAFEIVQAAADLSADIVMMGTHGFGGVKRFLLGSTSDDVMLYAPCSVLIVRSGKEESNSPAETMADTVLQSHPLKILLAFDNSRSSRKAARLCTKLSSAPHEEVIALSVLPLMHMFRQDLRQQLSWVWKERKKAVAKGLEWAEKIMSPASTKVSTLLKESTDVSREILDTAAETKCDLIVIGNRGESKVRQFLTGSVTRRIVHHAPCSVLAVRKCKKLLRSEKK
jgi:nucleotide-binding universal stress UspA family protein